MLAVRRPLYNETVSKGKVSLFHSESGTAMGLLLRLLLVLAVALIIAAPAPGLGVPSDQLHYPASLVVKVSPGPTPLIPSRPLELVRAMRALRALGALRRIDIGPSVEHQCHARSAELANPAPDAQSPASTAPEYMSDEDLAPIFIVQEWEFIGR